MAPCLDASAASMRHASMTMSCVAEEKPTKTANIAISPRFETGSVPAISHSPNIISPWQTSIHDRRCPSQVVSNGIRDRSINGAQRNLNECASVARLKYPITSRVRPAVRSQAERVSKIKRNGRPAENPNISMTMRSEEHTSELQSQSNLVCRLLLEKKKKKKKTTNN